MRVDSRFGLVVLFVVLNHMASSLIAPRTAAMDAASIYCSSWARGDAGALPERSALDVGEIVGSAVQCGGVAATPAGDLPYRDFHRAHADQRRVQRTTHPPCTT